MNGLLEKVIENWLDSASEKTFQEAFCAMMAAEGHTIVHLTRHCAMELGKDILSISSDGRRCAFQLKGNPKSRLTLRQWRDEVSAQVIDLVAGKLVHPSLPDTSEHHRSFLVTNGDLDEEVTRAIDDMNGAWKQQGLPYKLEVYVRGQLLAMAKSLGEKLWPAELNDAKTLLELFLANGRSSLDKEKFVSLIESTLLLQDLDKAGETSVSGWKRLFSSATLLCAVATSNYRKQNNHVAEIEAWTLLLSHLYAAIDQHSIDPKLVASDLQIARDAVYNCMHKLYEELVTRDSLSEGDPLLDAQYPLLKVRTTWLVGLMSVFYIWRRELDEPSGEIDIKLIDFCRTHHKNMILIGESVIPMFLSTHWLFKWVGIEESSLLLGGLLRGLCELNAPRSEKALASPYYSSEQLIPYFAGVATDPIEDSFGGSSYAIGSVMDLCVRSNWKDLLQATWPDITRIGFKSFQYETPSDMLRWRVKNGTNTEVFQPHTQTWNSLVKSAAGHDGPSIPVALKSSVGFSIIYIMVCAFRMNSDIVRWIDEALLTLQTPKGKGSTKAISP